LAVVLAPASVGVQPPPCSLEASNYTSITHTLAKRVAMQFRTLVSGLVY